MHKALINRIESDTNQMKTLFSWAGQINIKIALHYQKVYRLLLVSIKNSMKTQIFFWNYKKSKSIKNEASLL